MTSDAPTSLWVTHLEDQIGSREAYTHAGSWPGSRTEYILATPAALSDHPTVKQMVASERDAWREDPESSEAWCAGNQYVLDRLCVVAGADPAAVQWGGSDGSLNEEAGALIWRILRHNDDDDGLSPREKALVAEAEARGMERALIPVTALYEKICGSHVSTMLRRQVITQMITLEASIRAEAATVRKGETP